MDGPWERVRGGGGVGASADKQGILCCHPAGGNGVDQRIKAECQKIGVVLDVLQMMVW